MPPGSNCYRLRHEKGCLVWKPLILQRTFSQQKAGCVFVNILRTGCRRPPFVAATLSAFTVLQQRWDCDIPTVTLALPLVRFDQSVFLSPSPYYNFKIAFWPVQQIRHLRLTILPAVHHYYGMTRVIWQGRTQKIGQDFRLAQSAQAISSSLFNLNTSQMSLIRS